MSRRVPHSIAANLDLARFWVVILVPSGTDHVARRAFYDSECSTGGEMVVEVGTRLPDASGRSQGAVPRAADPRRPHTGRRSRRRAAAAPRPALLRESAGGSPFLAELLAFEASPVAVDALICAQRSGHHRHATAWADRWPVIHRCVSVSPAHGQGASQRLAGVRNTLRLWTRSCRVAVHARRQGARQAHVQSVRRRHKRTLRGGPATAVSVETHARKVEGKSRSSSAAPVFRNDARACVSRGRARADRRLVRLR